MTRCKEELFYYEGYETLAQVAQQSDGWPVFGSCQGQVGWDAEKPGLMKGVSDHREEGLWNESILKIPSNQNHFDYVSI